MTYNRAQFRDAASILSTYTFDIQWTDEEGRDLRRNLERTAVTSGVGFVRQQGEDSPETFKLEGTILKKSQETAFRAYYEACRTRTIFFKDIEGTEYEVLITVYDPQRKRTLRNPRDSSIPLHFWHYRMEIEVVG